MKIKNTILYFLSFPVFWVVYFLVFRITFLVYHHAIFGRFSMGQLGASFGHGLYMDLSMACYASVFPFIWWVAKDFISRKLWLKILSWYQLFWVFVFGFVLAADLEIFANWGHRLDTTIWPYLAFPKEAMASAASSPLRILFTVFGLSFVVTAMLWSAFNLPLLRKMPERSGHYRWIGLLLAGGLVIPIRGGLQLVPMNQSTVHFSTESSLNHAAENAIWVAFQSILENGSDEVFDKEYIRFPKNEATRFTDSLYSNALASPHWQVVQTGKPNIVLIIWESLTASVCGRVGGSFSCTPGLDKEAAGGLLFDKFYASGDRSDKGLTAILSGTPALGKVRIMQRPYAIRRLPFLSKTLKTNGYQTTFLYGGDLEFANMKSFMIEGGFDNIITREAFPPASYNSKWGAHDEVVFERQLAEARQAKAPFFHTLFTLSSHEPFEVPGIENTGNEPTDTLFCRAHRYTDRCLAQWFAKARKQAWWPNTWVIVVADHGHPLPGGAREGDLKKFHIPMVWSGGALTVSGRIVHQIGSQTDIAATVLGQLGLNSSPFHFSRNMLDTNANGFAFYAFHSGSGWVTREGANHIANGDKRSALPAWKPQLLYQQRVYQACYQPPQATVAE